MTFSRTLRSCGAPAIAAAAVIAALTCGAVADSPPKMPFTAPTGWQPMPSALIPTASITWSSGHSSFVVSKLSMSAPLTSVQLSQALKMGGALAGTIESSSSNPVCGQPAAQIVVKQHSGHETIQQMQTLAGGTYILVYLRPDSTPADPAIVKFMASYCGTKTQEASAPSGWLSHNFQILGMWLSPSAQTLIAMTSDPLPNAGLTAQDAVTSSIRTPNATITSHSTGALCGNPAYFFAGTATPQGMAASEIRAEYTQSATAAYMLVYSHPAASAADPAAIASLATLCAGPSGAMPTAFVP